MSRATKKKSKGTIKMITNKNKNEYDNSMNPIKTKKTLMSVEELDKFIHQLDNKIKDTNKLIEKESNFISKNFSHEFKYIMLLVLLISYLGGITLFLIYYFS